MALWTRVATSLRVHARPERCPGWPVALVVSQKAVVAQVVIVVAHQDVTDQTFEKLCVACTEGLDGPHVADDNMAYVPESSALPSRKMQISEARWLEMNFAKATDYEY